MLARIKSVLMFVIVVTMMGCGAGRSKDTPASLTLPAYGELAATQIQGVVRSNFGVFRSCYEEGLRRDPRIYGRMLIRFVIGRDGHVSLVKLGTASVITTADPPAMPDQEVVRCVLEGFKSLVFPRPEGGIVTVAYPILFWPGEAAE